MGIQSGTKEESSPSVRGTEGYLYRRRDRAPRTGSPQAVVCGPIEGKAEKTSDQAKWRTGSDTPAPDRHRHGGERGILLTAYLFNSIPFSLNHIFHLDRHSPFDHLPSVPHFLCVVKPVPLSPMSTPHDTAWLRLHRLAPAQGELEPAWKVHYQKQDLARSSIFRHFRPFGVASNNRPVVEPKRALEDDDESGGRPWSSSSSS